MLKTMGGKMLVILILGALFTGAGIYTMENSKVYKESRTQVMSCEKQGERLVCWKDE